jgi:hypothetical protein
MHHDRATALLAVVRIVAVLGMSFAIAGGIFLLLGGWWQPGLLALVAAAPFFALMRFMERRALRDDASG